MKLTKARLKGIIKEELKKVNEAFPFGDTAEDGLSDDERDSMYEDDEMESSFRNQVFDAEDRIQDAMAFISDMRSVTLEQFVADELSAEDIKEEVINNLNEAIDVAEGLAMLVSSYMNKKGIMS